MEAQAIVRSLSTKAIRFAQEARQDRRKAARILLVAVIACVAGTWIAYVSSGSESRWVQADRSRQVKEGLQTVSELFSRDLESLRTSARALRTTGVREGVPHGILLWAELESGIDGIRSIRRILTQPSWKPSASERQTIEGYFLQAATRYLNQPDHWREIRKGGTEMVRVKKTAKGSDEWAALAFSAGPGSTIIALIDPPQAFASVSSWGELGRGVGLRSYIVARDGHVLTHSQAAYNGSELRQVSAFRELAKSALDRTPKAPLVIPGVRAIDHLTVTLAAAKSPSLPLYLVIEKQIEVPLAEGKAPAGRPIQEEEGSFSWTFLVLALSGAAYWFWRRRRAPRNGLPERPIVASNPLFVSATAPTSLAAPLPYPETFEEALGEKALEAELAEMNARREELQAREREQAQRETMERAEAERLVAETARIEEERKADAALMAVEQELVTRFEIEVVKHSDPKKIAYAVTALGNRLCQAPALFFSYQPMIRKAILTTAVGFAQPVSARFGLTFDVSQDCMTKILESDAKGEVRSLNDHMPLSSMLQIAFGARQFKAWALTGETKFDWSGKSHAKLQGVLVILLPENPTRAAASDRLTPVLKATGLQYEKTLPRH